MQKKYDAIMQEIDCQMANIDLRECYGMYTDIKRRKNDTRTYFLDEMRKKLNQRMERDDEKERKRR